MPDIRRSASSPQHRPSVLIGSWAAAAFWVVAASSLLRVLLGAILGLGIDESYTVSISRQLSASYFDHPPLSFWIPGVLERLSPRGDLILRLPFILLFGVTTWLMYRLTSGWWGSRAGFYAALLLNVTPVFSISTGGWILPDGPLDCAMLAAVVCVSPLLIDHTAEGAKRSDDGTWARWLCAGFFAGTAFLAKYHAVFLPAGLLLAMVTLPGGRRWLARPQPYVAAAISLAFLAPVIWWNHEHAFASFRFQAGRGAPHPGGWVHIGALLQNMAGQAGYLLPWLWVPLVWQLVRGLRMGRSHPRRWLLCCLAVWPIGVFTLVSLGGNPGLPHWPAPGYLFLFPLLGVALAQRDASAARRRLTLATAAYLLLLGVAVSQVKTGWISRLRPQWFAHGDPSLDLVDWRELSSAMARYGGGAPPAFVATTHWIDAAKVGYALGPAVPILCLSDDQRHFAYLYDRGALVGRDGMLVARAGAAEAPNGAFASLELVGPVDIHRGGAPAIRLYVYRVRGLRPGSRAADFGR